MAKKFKHTVDSKPKSLWKDNGFNTTDEANKLSTEVQKAVKGVLNKWTDKCYKLNEIRQIATDAVYFESVFLAALKATK